MKGHVKNLFNKRVFLTVLALFSAIIMVMPPHVRAQQATTPPQPVVAIHFSEGTQALETIPAKSPTPSGSGTTGYQWWIPEWHYMVGPESLKEALRSDGTPFVQVSDANIAAGLLLNPDGSPKYPILISLASEAIADNEIAALRAYVNAGGFLFIGSSAFTRNPDGTTRGDFALASEMGLHMVNPTLQNWYESLTFTKVIDNRLVADIPAGTISWRMPLSSEEIPIGVSPNHAVHGYHWVFKVSADSSATVLANGDSGPLLATKQYGNGNFIYHADMDPLIGHTVYDPSMYAYMIYRRAIEWAFQAYNLPIIKLSPWRYNYDAAFIVRHDCENDQTMIRSIESSALYEYSLGVKGDYFFCTGTLRQEMPDENAVVANLKFAVSNYGATLGSHNGGLKNPNNASLPLSDFDYWHWGPDEALDVTPRGYASGKAYAQASLLASFQDIEGWMAGVDNGRVGCGSSGNCPRIWVAPYMDATREASYGIIEGLGAIIAGEQKIGPFPTWTLSTQTAGKRYNIISIPASDWYVGSEVPGALEWGQTTESLRAAVDFYYNLGAPINLYGHIVSDDTTLMGQYINYCLTKPRMWAANAVGISDWWRARSNAVVTPSYSLTGNTVTSLATITGALDAGTAIEVAIPNWNNPGVSNIQVFINDAPANPADYRTIGNTIKVRVGASTSSAKVQYTINTVNNPVPTTTSLSPVSISAGGAGFTLTVTGTGFINGSSVQWNGSNRTTTYVSTTQLTAVIPATDIAAAGTAAVTVFTSSPGGGTSNAQTFTINVSPSGTWTQTDWDGGGGQSIWADATRYDSASGIDNSINGLISLATTSTVLFSDNFTRPSGGTLLPWVASMGTWTVTGGVLQGTGSANQYAYVYFTPTSQWTDYTIQERIQIPAGSLGGGIGGRVNTSTGAHYGAWVYPAGSGGGSNVLKLVKFRDWTTWSRVPMQQINLPDVGTGWHTLQMTFIGNRILVYYDGSLKIDVTDNNFDSRAPYLSGGISVDWYTGSPSHTVVVDDVSAVTLPTYGSNGVLLSSAYDGGDGVQWQTVSWDANAAGSTNVCVKTRTADASDQLANSSWSNCYSASGSGLMSANSRWIQYQLQLSTSDTSTSPVFNEIRTSYFSSSSGAPIPVINTLAPTSSTAGGAGFTLTVNGSNFITGSVVQWNGASRTTTYVSATQLTAAILAGDIATAGTATVTVFTPAPGGGTSNAQIFTINIVNNPVPTATSLSPISATAGGAGFTLTVTGTGFVNGSSVQWNGSNRTTTYVSPTQLTAAIQAADIATAGTTTVTVFNPSPGGGTSNAQTFTINAVSAVLFSDNFTRPSGGTLSPWVVSMGTWTVSGGVMKGTGNANQYSYATMTPTVQWTDYTVQGRIQLPAGSYGGGIGGRINASTGTHYGAWVYPAGSPGGSNVLKLVKFRDWTTWNHVPMQQVNLPDVGTGWHTLQMTFIGSRILVYYDGVLNIDVTDNNFDSRAPYLSGGISVDWFMGSLPYTITVDDISVVTP